MNIFNELKRRNVFKAAIAYAVVAWIVLQVAAITFPPLNLPDWTMTMLIVFTLIGFPFICLFAWAFELTPDGIKPTSTVDNSESIRHETGHRLKNFIIVGLVIALGLVLVDSYVLTDTQAVAPAAPALAETTPAPSTAVTATTLDLSIAVLPFTNLSDDPQQEYFSDGLAEELLNKLAQVPDLLVAGRTSSFYYKDRNEDLRVIGETLGVAHILEGSVRKSGNQVRITTQLIKAEDGYQLWSDTFDRELTDIFSVQDDIAEAVTTALSITMQAGQFSQPGMTSNIEAYDAYLKGLQQVSIFTPNSMLEAIDNFERAVTLDPGFAVAWVNLARTLAINSNVYTSLQNAGNYDERILTALEQARELEPGLPEVRVMTATRLMFIGDFAGAESLLQQTLQESQDNSVSASMAYGGFLDWSGRSTDALPWLMQARRLDPLNAETSWYLSQNLLALNRTSEALREIERGTTLTGLGALLPGMRFVAALQTGDPQTVLRALEQMPGFPNAPDVPGSNRRLINLWLAGELETAHAEIREWAMADNAPAIRRILMAQWATAMGAPELALEIRRTIGDFSTLWMPYSRELRQLPQFGEFLAEIGLVDYWRSTGNWPDLCRPVNDSFECN